MNAISTTDARTGFAETLNQVAYTKERIILKRRGKSFVAIIPIEDLKLLEEFEDKMDLKEAKLRTKEETVSWKEVQKKAKHSK